MERITIGQHSYVIGKLDAFSQLHVSRRITPIIPTIAPLLAEVAKGGIQEMIQKLEMAKDQVSTDGQGGNALADMDLTALANAAKPFADALAEMSDENADYVTKKCLSVVKRDNGGSLASVCVNGSLMFDDLDLGEILPLVIAVLRTSLGNFIRGLVTKAVTESQPK